MSTRQPFLRCANICVPSIKERNSMPFFSIQTVQYHWSMQWPSYAHYGTSSRRPRQRDYPTKIIVYEDSLGSVDYVPMTSCPIPACTETFQFIDSLCKNLLVNHKDGISLLDPGKVNWLGIKYTVNAFQNATQATAIYLHRSWCVDHHREIWCIHS